MLRHPTSRADDTGRVAQQSVKKSLHQGVKGSSVTLGQDVPVMRVGFVRRVLTPCLGPVVIYSQHQRLRVDAGLTVSAATLKGRFFRH